MEQPNYPKHIRFCVNNPRNILEREGLIRAGYQCRDCLSNCTQCFETRFLEIQDTFVEGDSYEHILTTPLQSPPAQSDQSKA